MFDFIEDLVKEINGKPKSEEVKVRWMTHEQQMNEMYSNNELARNRAWSRAQKIKDPDKRQEAEDLIIAGFNNFEDYM